MYAVASYFSLQSANEACQKLIDAGHKAKWCKSHGRFFILSNAETATAREVLS